MAGKRKNGEGSWGKKKIKGTTYCYFRDKEGHYTYGKTEKEVKEKLENKANSKKLPVNKKAMTVGSYVKDWLYSKKYKDVGIVLESTTFDNYEASLAVRFFQYPISRLKLNALTRDALVKYLRQLSKKYSRWSIVKTWRIISMALTDEDYENYKYVPQIDIHKIKLPNENNVAVKKKEHNFTSNEDMDKIYNEALRKDSKGNYKYGNAARMLAFIMYSGLRVAEATGLKWKDVSKDFKMITIRQTMMRTRRRDEDGNALSWQIIEKAPKSKASAATIPIRKRGTKILKLMDSIYPDHTETDYVFPNNAGRAFTKAFCLSSLKRILDNAEIKNDYTVHDLRHGYGSILYQEHVDILTISKLLRHSDIQTTANIYVKTTPETLKEALSKVDGV